MVVDHGKYLENGTDVVEKRYESDGCHHHFTI